uniref:AAA_5 domain-containing protein n=1 Tax=Heterorhabditis bacteriophora TaxID=37862 RepID=A0A1I7X5Q8_HETBA
MSFRFLPSITRTAFSSVLEKAGISNDTTLSTDGDEAMIPDVLFYDNEQHLSVMRDMARDMELGAHLLLIGNQGVGKNKITDRFLHLINRPRQYMQLHRLVFIGSFPYIFNMFRFSGDSLLKNITNSIFGENNWRLVNCEQPIAILFQRDGRRVITLDSEKGMIDMELPHQISSIFSISLDRLLVKFQDSSLHLLTSESGQYYLYPLDFPHNQPFELESLRVDNKSVYMAADNFYCLKTNGFPLGNVLASIRHTPSEVIDERRPYYLSDQNTKRYIDSNCNMIVMQGGIVIRSQPKWNVPKNSFNSDILNIYHVGGFLEVIDPNNGFIQYVPVPEPKYKSYHG